MLENRSDQKSISIIQTFKDSIVLYKSNFGLFFFISLVASGIPFVNQSLFASKTSFGLFYVFMFFAGTFLSFWAYSALIFSISKRSNGQESNIKESFLSIRGKIFPFMGVSIFKGLVVILGLLIFVIPGLYFGVIFSMAGIMIVLEDTTLFGSLKRSKDLIKGYFWQVFLLNLVLWVIMLPVYFVYMLPMDMAAKMMTVIFISAILYPLSVIVNIAVYNRLNVIKGLTESLVEKKIKKGVGCLGCLGSIGLFLSIIVVSVIWFGIFSSMGGNRCNIQQPPVKIQSVEIVEFGELSKENIFNQTDLISAKMNTSFGIGYKPQGVQGKLAHLKVRYLHPDIIHPLTQEVLRFDEMEQFSRIGSTVKAFWVFEKEWEMVPGIWTIQVLQDDHVLAESKFNIVGEKDFFSEKIMRKIDQLKEEIVRSPQNAMAVKELGNFYVQIKDYERAIVEYEKAIKIESHPNFFNNICLAYNNLEEYDKALENCQHALFINPEHTSAFINRGNSYRLLGQYDNAISDYTQSLKVVPAGDIYNPPMAYYNRALAYQSKGDLVSATKDCQKALSSDVSDQLLKARLYSLKGELAFKKFKSFFSFRKR